jgi:hypothetical protein
MPLHVAPALRAREEAMEAAGIIAPMDSQGVTLQKAAEAAGLVKKVVPACQPIIFNNVAYQPK